MKRTFIQFVAIAIALVSLASCEQESIDQAQSAQTYELSFSSDKPSLETDTKTAWTGETINWSKGDKIKVAYTVDGVWQGESGNPAEGKYAKLYVSSQLSADAPTATFKVPTSFAGTTEGTYKFYGVYPSTSVSVTEFRDAPSLTVDIPAEQTPAASSFDSAADVMIGQSKDEYTAIPTDAVPMIWNRIVAHADITLKSLIIPAGETISKITFTANEEANLVGAQNVDITTRVVSKGSGNTAANVVAVNANNLQIINNNIEVWFGMLPATITSLAIDVETDLANYSKSYTGISRTFAQNKRNTMGINMSGATRTAKSVSNLPFEDDFSWQESTDENTKIENLSSDWVSGTNVYGGEVGAIKIGSGKSNGSITSKNLNLSNPFHVTVSARAYNASDESSLVVTVGNNSYTADEIITSTEDYTNFIINCPAATSSSSVTIGTDNKRAVISNVKIETGNVALTPKISVVDVLNVPATATSGTINVSYKNVVSQTVKVYSDESLNTELTNGWFNAVLDESGNISWTVTANETENTRTAYISLKAKNVAETEVGVVITVTQVPQADAVTVEQSSFTTISGDLNNDPNISYSALKGDGTTNPAINSNKIRIYKPASGNTTGGVLKLTANNNCKITAVTIKTNRKNAFIVAVDGAAQTPSYQGESSPYSVSVSNLLANEVTFTNTYNDSNDISYISVSYSSDGGEVPPTTSYTVNISDTITGGSVTANPMSAIAGTEITLTATPSSGYTFTSWNVTNATTSEIIMVTNNKFMMPASNVNVSATFTEDEEQGEENVAIFSWVGSSTDTKNADWTISDNGVSLTWSKGTNQNTPSPNKEGSIRMYPGTTVTITAPTGEKVTKIEFTPTAETYSATNLTYNDNSISDDWTLSAPASPVVLTATANARFKTITVHFR